MVPNGTTVLMEGVRLIYRNFQGRETQYNREGAKDFAVLLDSETAAAMAEDEWNIKFLKPRPGDEDEEPKPYLPVALKYDKGRPPRVVLITSRGRTPLDENTVETLDYVDIINVDLMVRSYVYHVNGKTGVKAYLQSLYVTIDEDPLEQKYAELSEPQ